MGMMKLEFYALGIPAPGGSKTAIPMYDGSGKLVTKPTGTGRERPVLRYVDDAKGNVAWRKIVGWSAKAQMLRQRIQMLDGPLRFTVEFVMPRGSTVRRAEHTVKPDLSKLIRSTEDALTGVAWLDDAQITDHGPMRKRYVRLGEQTGARITIETLALEQELPLVEAPPTPQRKPEPVLLDSPFD